MILKVSPARGTLRFGEKGKPARRYVGPFEIRSMIDDAAYKLQLPLELSGVHDVFHVSMLKKYVEDPTHVLYCQLLDIQPDVSYIARPVVAIDTKEQVLRTRTIHWVKVQ